MNDVDNTVNFIRMEDGTRQEYQLLHRYEKQYSGFTAQRVMDHMQSLSNSFAGYKVTRLEHGIQSATRAWADDAGPEMTVAALLHDIGDALAPENHSELAASILRPYVSQKTYWVVKHHGIFQGYYFFHHIGLDRDLRNRYKDHPYYQACADFCANWDQVSFDPDYPSKTLDFFEPMVEEIFAREPFGEHTR